MCHCALWACDHLLLVQHRCVILLQLLNQSLLRYRLAAANVSSIRRVLRSEAVYALEEPIILVLVMSPLLGVAVAGTHGVRLLKIVLG